MLSLVIVNYNTRELLRACLESIRRHEPNAQVIVADNASRDGSPEMVKTDFPEVELVETGWNAGFAAANNAGLAKAKGEFVVLLNSDTVLENPTLSDCVVWMRQNPQVGATSPPLIGSDHQPQECFYPFPCLKQQFQQAVRRSSHAHQGTWSREQGWIAGTALMIRRQALDQIGGGLDDRYWMYWEDADLSAKLIKAGWIVKPAPSSHHPVRHYGGASGGGADCNRRPDLHAWYLFGKLRWFAKHRSRLEFLSLWFLELIDVPRQYLRGWKRPTRQIEQIHAKVKAQVLWNWLHGKSPA